VRRAGFCPTIAHEDWAVPQVCQAEWKKYKKQIKDRTWEKIGII